MSFEKQLRAFAKGAQAKIDKTVKGATVTLAANIITETPVDTGAARGNWQTSVGQPKTDVIDRPDQSGEQAIREAAVNTPDKAGDVVFIANNLPYINMLEHGHSEQAPAGMARVNIARWPAIVRQEAAKHK